MNHSSRLAHSSTVAHAALVVGEGLTPEAARPISQRIAPVLAGHSVDDLLPRVWVCNANAHGVPHTERTVLFMLCALAIDVCSWLPKSADKWCRSGLDVICAERPSTH